MDRIPPTTQWLYDPLPAVKTAGYHVAPVALLRVQKDAKQVRWREKHGAKRERL